MNTDSRDDLPARLILLLTTPRSGSTWFADAIRCHPAIQYWPAATVYRKLGFTGRRYPRDLAGGPDAVVDIEVLPGKWEKIPDFSVAESRPDAFPRGMLDNNFAIEKCHPEFFTFNVGNLLRNIGKLEQRGNTVRMVYLVRDPVASFASFMRYQERNPNWYPSVRGKTLAEYMHRSFSSILEAARQRTGMVIDYSSIVSDLAGTLERVYAHIWPQQEPAACEFNRHIARMAIPATERRKRSATGSAFLGAKAGSVRGGLEKSDPFLAGNRDIVDHCYVSYRQLLDLCNDSGQTRDSMPCGMDRNDG